MQSFQLCAVLCSPGLLRHGGVAAESFSAPPVHGLQRRSITAVGEVQQTVCDDRRPSRSKPPPPVVQAPARLAFRDGAVSQINLPIPGRVTAVHVKTGDWVKAGDPLLTLSSPEAAAARASLAAAQAEHDAAKREVARQDQMATSGVGIDSERVAA